MILFRSQLQYEKINKIGKWMMFYYKFESDLSIGHNEYAYIFLLTKNYPKVNSLISHFILLILPYEKIFLVLEENQLKSLEIFF